MIKREKIEGSAYRQILTALITSDDFLERFSEKYKPDFFEASFAQTICRWCIKFYEKYQEAPKNTIENIFESAERDSKKHTPEELQLIKDLLISLNGVYENEDLHIPSLLDKVKILQQKQDFDFLQKELREACKQNDLEYAHKLVQEYQTFEEENDDDYKPDQPLIDQDTADTIFSSSKEPLFTYTGALGQLINNGFVRDSLVSIRAVSGVGKSQMLNDIVIKSCMHRLNVAYFQVGDMSKGQANERLFLNMGGVPRRALDKDHRKPVIDCKSNQDNSCPMIGRLSNVDITDGEGNLLPEEKRPKNYMPCDRCHKKGIKFPVTTYKVPYYTDEVMTPDTVKKWQKIFGARMKGRKLFTKTYANDSVNVHTIDKLLGRWKKDYNFTPDIVVIDYADILAPEPNASKEDRLIIETRYKRLRNLGQKYNCCVCTAEQASAEYYKSEIMDMNSFSGGKGKNDNITFGIYLVQNDYDKENSLIRMGVYKDRNNEFNKTHQVVVLQDLARGIFHLDSYWKYVIEENIKKDYKKRRK